MRKEIMKDRIAYACKKLENMSVTDIAKWCLQPDNNLLDKYEDQRPFVGLKMFLAGDKEICPFLGVAARDESIVSRGFGSVYETCSNCCNYVLNSIRCPCMQSDDHCIVATTVARRAFERLNDARARGASFVIP